MKYTFFFVLIFASISCGGKTSLSSTDQDYVNITLDLLRTRAAFAPGIDSIRIMRSLDSVYTRHHTTLVEYKKESSALSEDRDRTAAVFNAINDSIGK
ncbi:MAG TPA: hypothetical protein VGM92_00770 [Candidatus Kapabacteria bacterium]|jgi:hypothetical protein